MDPAKRTWGSKSPRLHCAAKEPYIQLWVGICDVVMPAPCVSRNTHTHAWCKGVEILGFLVAALSVGCCPRLCPHPYC